MATKIHTQVTNERRQQRRLGSDVKNIERSLARIENGVYRIPSKKLEDLIFLFEVELRERRLGVEVAWPGNVAK